MTGHDGERDRYVRSFYLLPRIRAWQRWSRLARCEYDDPMRYCVRRTEPRHGALGRLAQW